MKKLINDVIGKRVKTCEYDDDTHADPRVSIVFEDDTRFVIHETRQAGWIDWFIENPKYEAVEMEHTLRWVVVNNVSFTVNQGTINAHQTDGMTGCDYDTDVPGCHWDNIEKIYPGAKLDGRHRETSRG